MRRAVVWDADTVSVPHFSLFGRDVISMKRLAKNEAIETQMVKVHSQGD
ncbi:hypothetical protein [Peribacillus butanolivorans]